MKLPWFGIVTVVTLVVGCSSWLTGPALAQGAEPLSEEQAHRLFEEARQLQRDGRGREAFL